MTRNQVYGWGQVITKYGLPTVALIVVCYAVAHEWSWVKGSVLQPLIANHLEYLHDTKAIMERQADTLDELKKGQQETYAAVKESSEKTVQAIRALDAKQ